MKNPDDMKDVLDSEGKEMLVIEKEKELHSFLLHTIPATPELRDGKGRRVGGR